MIESVPLIRWFRAFPFNDSRFLMNFLLYCWTKISFHCSITISTSSTRPKIIFHYRTAAFCAEIPFLFFSRSLSTWTHFTHNIPLLLFLRSQCRNTWRLSQYIFLLKFILQHSNNCTFKKIIYFSVCEDKKVFWRQIYLRIFAEIFLFAFGVKKRGKMV